MAASEEYILQIGTIITIISVSILAMYLLLAVNKEIEFFKLQREGMELSLLLSQNSSLTFSFNEKTNVRAIDHYLMLKRGSFSVIFPYIGDHYYEQNDTLSICIHDYVRCGQ